MYRSKCLTTSHCCPGFFVSPSQNISRVEKRNKDDWRSWAESHQLPCWQPGDVHTLLMCGLVTADWQPKTGRQERWSLLRTPDAHCLCSALSSGAATLTRSRSRHAVPGWADAWLSWGWKLQLFLHASREAESFVFLMRKIRFGCCVCIWLKKKKKNPQLHTYEIIRDILAEVFF